MAKSVEDLLQDIADRLELLITRLIPQGERASPPQRTIVESTDNRRPLTDDELATYFQCCKAHIQRMRKHDPNFPSVRIGKLVRTDRVKAEAYFERLAEQKRQVTEGLMKRIKRLQGGQA